MQCIYSVVNTPVNMLSSKTVGTGRSAASGLPHPLAAGPAHRLVSPCSRSAVPCPSRQRMLPRIASLDTIQKARPIDRLRYQAKFVFEHFDKDGDGALSTEELAAFVEYCDERFGKGLYNLDDLYTPLLTQGTALPFEEFVELVRQQVAVLKKTRFLEAQMKGAEIGRLLYKCAVPTQELTAAMVVFKLVDLNNDGFLRLDEYGRVQGIEKKILTDVLMDADDNNDGFLSFEDFMSSYSRERPVMLSMAVMAAHTLAYWFIFNSPLDTVMKGALAVLLLIRPAMITNPVIKIWHIFNAIFNRARAEAETTAPGGTAAA